MRRALIGHTGFVGGNLARQIPFDELYHSKNIAEMRGRFFDEVFCAGVSAVKWLANKEPERDLQGIAPLLAVLESVRAERFVLLSTVDVYRTPFGVDEETPIDTDGLHPYGSHRRLVETFVRERFADALICRLPGLVGEGLKKNVVYDLLNRHQLDSIHAEALFQFYDLENLGRDLRTALDHGLALVNFATEPVSVRQIALHAFRVAFDNRLSGPVPRYDMRTRHAALFGGDGAYLYSRPQVLEQIRSFVDRQKGGGAA